MARTVDQDTHERRRAQLAAAVYAIVARDGIDQVSVRSVAREAGLSMGTLRHYFATQSELLAFSLAEVERELRAALVELDPDDDPRHLLEQVVHLLVPTTEQTRVAHQLWLAFLGKAQTDPTLRELNERTYQELRGLLRRLVAAVLGMPPATGPAAPTRAGHARTDRDRVDHATDKLYALVDGLALQATLHPADWPPHRITTTLRSALADLS